LVLVGHSTGGLTIPILAARRPVKEMVFLCAAVPVPGEYVAERGVEWQVTEPAEWQIFNDNGSFSASPEGFRRYVAPDMDPELIEPTELPGDHSPMASRPQELAELLMS
jgi:pimeloyl-ACP methyl ester carboxylesterase